MQVLKDIPNFKYLESLIGPTKALLWDMDGTICHTEKFHAMALESVFQKYSPENNPYSLNELEKLGTGLTDAMVFKNLQDQGFFKSTSAQSLLDFKNSSFDHILQTQDLETIFHPKLRELFNECYRKNILLAVVTSSEKKAANDLLGALGIKDFFKIIITQEDTTENKPNPAPYLHAMKLLNLQPSDVTIFEDSPTGLEAARLSQANVFKVQWYS